MLPCFRRSEDNGRGADAFHGSGGPMRVEDLRSPSALSGDYLDACVEAGLEGNDDFNGAHQEGVGGYQVTQRKGRRESTATAFLRPALRRPNLEVRTYAQATRVLVEGGWAVGVEVQLAGRRQVFRARREVVLCGGAVNTPQLLLLSGIGPADELRALGIDVVVDSPQVGQGLQDHLAVGAVFRAHAPVSYFEADKRPAVVAQYLLRRRGPFSSNIAEAGGFVRTRSDLPGPDLQLLFGPAMFVRHGLEDAPGHGFSLGAYLLTPQSRGSITLAGADPLAKPRIRAGYLTEPADLDVLVEGLRLSLEIASRRPLLRHSAGPASPRQRSAADGPDRQRAPV